MGRRLYVEWRPWHRKTGRPEDRKTGRPEDRKTGRPEDRKTGRPEDRKTGRPEDGNDKGHTANSAVCPLSFIRQPLSRSSGCRSSGCQVPFAAALADAGNSMSSSAIAKT